MTIQNLDEAKRVFETYCDGAALARAVGVLVKAGTSEDEARGWAADTARTHGLPIQPDEFSRIVRRGLALAAPLEEPDEPEAASEAKVDLNVRPNLPQFEVPLAGLTASELLALATDPAGTKRRLSELEKAIASIADASQALAAARAAFDRKVEKVQADLDRRSAEIEKRRITVFQKETALEETREHQIAMAAELARLRGGRLEKLGETGCVREWVAGQPTGEIAFAPTTYTAPEVPRPRRGRPRRSAEL